MQLDTEKLNNTETAEVLFSRDLGLFDATMIGAGIFVLTGIAAGEAGPAALLTFDLNGLGPI